MLSVEPFLDRNIIKEKSNNIIIEETIPEFERIVLEVDKHWEGDDNAYYTIINKNNMYEMYYRAQQGLDTYARCESVCLAKSKDGLNFEKNNYCFNDNNKIFQNNLCHNFFPYYSEKKGYYIGLSGTKEKNGGLFLLKSYDGIDWLLVKKILDSSHVRSGYNHVNHFDTCNTITYNSNEDIYYILIRDNRSTIENNIHMGRRVQYIRMDKNFELLSNKCESIIINNNISNYPIYSFGCCHYPCSKYFISIPTLVDENYINGKWEQNKKIGQILVSQNCHEWDIVSENIYKKNMSSNRFNAVGIVVSPNRDKLYFYVQNKFALPKNNIECYSFPMNRINRIKCINNGYIKTDKINLISNKIRVNFETIKESGYISINIYNQNNNLLLTSNILTGNHLELPVIWKEEKELDKGKYFIEFILYNCILYSFSYVI